MINNWFVFAIGIMHVAAAVKYFFEKGWVMGGVVTCYAIAAILFSLLRMQ